MTDQPRLPATTKSALLRLASCVSVIAAGAGLLACGGSSPPSASASAAQDAFKFSRCMREHGIANFPDPETGPNGSVRLQFKTGTRPNRRTFEVAQGACKKYSPGGRVKLTPAQRVEQEEAVRKFAKCMREHGVNIPTPTVSDSGARIRLAVPGSPGSGGGPNPESPAFQAAQKACQGLLPKRPGGGGGGPQTSSSGGSGGGSGFSLSAGG